jgi:RNA polymerase sigma factor (sigma-70 family)
MTRSIDDAARKRIEENLHLAKAGAMREFHRRFRHGNRSVSLEELESDAQLGLVYAAIYFEPQRGAPFDSFAWVCIRNHVMASCQRRRRATFRNGIRFADMTPEGMPGLEPSCPKAERSTDRMLDRDLLQLLRRYLPPRLWRVLELHFIEDLTLAEVGQRFGGLSRERVRQLVEKGIRHGRRLSQRCG